MSKENGATYDDVLAQCYVALGQGAGSMIFSPSGVKAVRVRYRKLIKENLAQWNRHAPIVLLQARSMGRMAADIASAAGSFTIDGEHFMQATEQIQSHYIELGSSPWPLDCPWCPPFKLVNK